jgi:hypothetical protein
MLIFCIFSFHVFIVAHPTLGLKLIYLYN